MPNPVLTDAEIQTALETVPWTFAKTLAHIPHEYLLEEKWPCEVPFTEVQRLIAAHGYDGKWGRQTFRYLHLGGFKYWQDEAYTKGYHVLNRVRLSAAEWEVTWTVRPTVRSEVQWLIKQAEKHEIRMDWPEMVLWAITDGVGEPIGTIGLRCLLHRVVIDGIFVHPAHRKRGAAWAGIYAVWNEAVRQAIYAGHRKLEATCTKDSLPMFLKLGFKAYREWPRCTQVRRSVTMADIL